MITPKELLDISTQKIQDKENAVKVCLYKRIKTDEGYSFIVLNRRKAKSIVATVELNIDWAHDEDIGYFKQINCKVNTQEKLKGDTCILYQDAVIFINDFSSYTESIGQYEYSGRAVSIDKLPLLDGSMSSDKVYGYSCLDLLTPFDECTVLPEYLSLDLKGSKEGIFFAKVEETKSMDMIHQYGDKLAQMKIDSLRISAVNVDRNTVMHFVPRLLEYGYDLFGLSGEYTISESNNYDDYSNLRGIRYSISLKLCYNLYTINEIYSKNISTILFKMKER